MKLNDIKALKEQKNDLIEKQSSLFVGITETRAMEEVKNGETFVNSTLGHGTFVFSLPAQIDNQTAAAFQKMVPIRQYHALIAAQHCVIRSKSLPAVLQPPEHILRHSGIGLPVKSPCFHIIYIYIFPLI